MGTLPSYYQSTPSGIVTSGGGWYLAPETAIEAYAGDVLKHVPLSHILRFADTWALLPSTIGVLGTIGLLYVSPWSIALGAGLLLYVVARLLLPGVVLPSLSKGVRVAVHPVFQVLFAFLALSYLGMQGQIGAASAGLAAFVAYRWDLPGILLNPIVQPMLSRMYPLPVADQILRASLIRFALRHGVELPQIAVLEAQMRKTMNRNKP